MSKSHLWQAQQPSTYLFDILKNKKDVAPTGFGISLHTNTRQQEVAQIRTMILFFSLNFKETTKKLCVPQSDYWTSNAKRSYASGLKNWKPHEVIYRLCVNNSTWKFCGVVWNCHVASHEKMYSFGDVGLGVPYHHSDRLSFQMLTTLIFPVAWDHSKCQWCQIRGISNIAFTV
jgi:hypothetical protein